METITQNETILKRIPFRQSTMSGCGSLSLANLFNDKRFIEGIEDLKVGERTVDLNRKMDKYFPAGYIDTLYSTCSGFTMQANRLIDPIIFGIEWEQCEPEQKEGWAKPHLVVIKRTPIRCHCILVVQNLKDSLLYVVDSLKEYIEKYTIEDFLKWYHVLVVEVFGLWEMENPENTMFIIKEHYPHLFNEGE